MSDILMLYRAFVRVVEAGSFTAAAEERNTTQPTISRQIAALEAHLGCLLFQRSTRTLTSTEDGRNFYALAREALDAVDAAEGAVGRQRRAPTGRLRVTCAVVMGRLYILPCLGAFMERYPGVDVELLMHDGATDLIEEGVDLAVRVGDVADPSLVSRRIGMTRRVMAASAEYLARRGEPRRPEDLAGHDCIVYSRLASGPNWLLKGPDGEMRAHPVRGRLTVNNTEAVRGAILAGLGVGIAPAWHFVDGEFADGRLKVLMPDHAPESHPIHVVYPSRRYVPAKVRAMIDFLVEAFADEPLFQG